MKSSHDSSPLRTPETAVLGFPTIDLSLALAGLPTGPGSAPTRRALEWAASVGFRHVQLNAAAPDARPRDLSRSARRDLAALLRRLELSCSGVDLWAPPGDFLDHARADRAWSAAGEAAEFAAEIALLAGGRARLALSLPPDERAAAAVAALAERSQRHGTRIADYSWPTRWHQQVGGERIGVGIDPAVLLLAGEDPAARLSQAGQLIAGARLTDLSASGRVEPGSGRLDLTAYLAAIATNPAHEPAVLDVRGLPSADAVAARILTRIQGER